MPFVQTRDVTLFVTEVGSPDNPAILFSNSLGTTHRMWDGVVEELSAEFRCIRYDTRGHGASTLSKTPFEIADLAADAIAILDNLGIRQVHFAALSLGGMTGQALAIHHPDRLASLTLMATTANMPPAQAWMDRAELVRREGTKAILEATLPRWFTADYLALEPAVVLRAAQEFCAIDSEGYAACCEAIARMDLRDLLPGIAAPTLIIAGAQDPATPPTMAEAMRDAIANARLEILDPAAHLLATERPAETAAMLARHIHRHLRADWI